MKAFPESINDELLIVRAIPAKPRGRVILHLPTSNAFSARRIGLRESIRFKERSHVCLEDCRAQKVSLTDYTQMR